MYKQFEMPRRMPEKRTERSIFATEMCVLGDSRTMHVYYYYIRSCPRAKFCFLFPVKVNNC